MKTTTAYRIVLPLLAAGILAGCAGSSRLQSTYGNKYSYSASMTAPVSSKEMLFRDDRMIVQFRLDDPGLRFQLQNLSAEEMQIGWANTSITVHGTKSPVRTTATLYDTSGAAHAGQSVPSLGVIRDAILPVSGAYFDGRRWRVDDLLPTTDANARATRSTILQMVGSTIELAMPVQCGSEMREYRFSFVIDSVRQIAWNAFRPAGWLPPPPPVHGLRPGTDDQVAAVIIAGSFLGFLRYMTSAKKTPVVE